MIDPKGAVDLSQFLARDGKPREITREEHLSVIATTHDFAVDTVCTDCGHQHACHETARSHWQCQWCATGRTAEDPARGGRAS